MCEHLETTFLLYVLMQAPTRDFGTHISMKISWGFLRVACLILDPDKHFPRDSLHSDIPPEDWPRSAIVQPWRRLFFCGFMPRYSG